MTNQVDTVPHILSSFTTAAHVLRIAQTEPTPTVTTSSQWVPSDRHGRIPTIGLDTGHIPGTRPDTIHWR